MNLLPIMAALTFHYLGDMSFQTSWMIEAKRKGGWYPLFGHCMAWTAAVSIPLMCFGMLEPWKIVFLVSGHFAMDNWKCKQPRDKAHSWMMAVDQVWHIVQVILVSMR